MALLIQTYGLPLPPLHAAAAQGDLAALDRALVAGDEIDAPCDTAPGYGAFFQHLTPLMVAAGSEHGTAAAVQLLLSRGADPRAVSAGGVTALWYAAGSGDPARVALLLAAGGDPRETAANGRTTLGEAATVGDVETLRLLLGAGASPHPSSSASASADASADASASVYRSAASYQIPLFVAAISGNANCVRALLEHGVRADVRDDSGATALMSASSPEVVRVLLAAGCPRDARNAHGSSALDVALEESCPDVARALVAAGADLETRDDYGQTVLLRQAGSLSVDAASVQLLLELGADPHARTPNGQTAIHRAAQLWSSDRDGKLGPVIRHLAAAGVPVDARDASGHTALHLALGDEGGDLGAVTALLDLGADIEARDPHGQTPLMLAARGRYRERFLIKLLLERGADPAATDATDSRGQTARDIAAACVATWERILAPSTETDTDAAGIPGQRAVQQARQRMKLRSVRAALALLDPEAPPPQETLPAGAATPPPVFLGYRVQALPPPPREPRWGRSPETDHITAIGSLACLGGSGRDSATPMPPEEFHPTEADAWAAARAADTSSPQAPLPPNHSPALALYAYRALPLSFTTAGTPEPLHPTDLSVAELPPAPDLAPYRFLGHDIKEHRIGTTGGCSPLSCNGLAVDFSVVVNPLCLIDDLAAAWDVALLCGMEPPEPGPYIIIEVWRAESPIAPPTVEASQPAP